MMPMRGALTLGTTAQELVEALVMQLAERQVALGTVHRLFFSHYMCKTVWSSTPYTFLLMLQTAWRTPKDFRLLFHCFSNTGWYTFGAVMEGLLKHAVTLLQHVIGSVVDSAPHAEVSFLLLIIPQQLCHQV